MQKFVKFLQTCSSWWLEFWSEKIGPFEE